VTSSKGTSSYVTVRGSIPLYWQEGDALVTLKPKPRVLAGKAHLEAMRVHFQRLAALYGPVLMLSLIDALGNEANINRALSSFASRVLRSNAGAPLPSDLGAFVPFDFHAECGKSASAAGVCACACAYVRMWGYVCEYVCVLRQERLCLRYVCVCVCVCVRMRTYVAKAYICVCVCVSICPARARPTPETHTQS